MSTAWTGAPGALPQLPAPGGHYSHTATGRGLVFVSGQLPIRPDGTRLDRLLQVRVYLDDIAHWPAFDRIYAAWAGAHRPARAVVPTGPLHFGLKVEAAALA